MAEEKTSCARWKRILAWIVSIVLAVVVLLAILLLGAVPERQVHPLASSEENLAVMTVVSKLSNALFAKNGKIAAESTIELTPAEVNALLATAIRAYQVKHSGIKDPVLFGELRDKKIYLYCGVPLTGRIAINARCAVAPYVSGKKLNLNFSDLQAGRLPLPGSLASRIVAEVIKELEKKPEYQSAMEVITDLRINTAGNLEVTFIPVKVSALLTPLLSR